MLPKLIEFKTLKDERGSLSFFEIGASRQVPFEIKRVYFLYHLNEEPRGFHAHKELRQLAVCISGSCTVLLDDGKEKIEVIMNKPNQGLFIEKMIWHEMSNFSKDAVFLVFASEYYEESDYIRKYDEFLKLI